MLEVTEATSIAPNVASTHIALQTLEGRRFLCRKSVMQRSCLLIQQLLEALDTGDDAADGEILELPLPAVDTEALQAVYAFLLHHYDDNDGSNAAGGRGPSSSSPSSFVPPVFKEIEKPLRSDLSTLVSPWDWTFISQTLLKGRTDGSNGPMLLFAVLNASNFLNIPPLRELCSAAAANMMRGKSDAEIMALFGVSSFTKADEEDICRDYPWLQEADP